MRSPKRHRAAKKSSSPPSAGRPSSAQKKQGLKKAPSKLQSASKALDRLEPSQLEKRYQALFETTHEGILIVNDQGRYVDVNESMAKMLRTSRQELIGQFFPSFIPPDRLKEAEKAFSALKDTGTFEGEFPLRAVDGTIVELEWRSRSRFVPGLHFCVARDITEKKKSGQMLKAREKLFATLTSLAPVGIFLTSPSGSCEFVNERWCGFAGLSPDQAKGMGWVKALHPDDKNRVFREWDEAARAGKEFSSEYRFRTPAGKITWLHGAAVPLRDDNGAVIAHVGTITDITASKMSEQRLVQQTEELSKSNRELEQFATISSHDLKEPLRKVSAFAQILEAKYKGRLDDEADKILAQITSSVSRMQGLIDALLSYSQLERSELSIEKVDLSAVAQEAICDLETAIRDKEALIKLGPLPKVFADRVQIRQVLQNLVSNAVKFSDSRRPQVEITSKSENGKWIISVKDNGIGIEEKHFGQIFKLFQRLHSRDKFAGTGIGLAVCKKIVERHGGEIGVSSVPGNGSVFFFSLPKDLRS